MKNSKVELESLLSELEVAIAAKKDALVSEQAKKIREALSLGVVELALKIGCSDQTWYRIESRPVGFTDSHARMARLLPNLIRLIRGGAGLISRAHIDAIALTDITDTYQIQQVLEKLWAAEASIGVQLSKEAAAALVQDIVQGA